LGSTAHIIVEEQKRRRGRKTRRTILLLILIVSGVLCYRFIAWPLLISGFGQVDTRPVPGDASRFDTVAALPDIRTYAGDGAQLISIEADYVRSDGTLELTADYSPSPNVEYQFAREVPRPADAPPIGAGGANTGPWYEPITVKVDRPGKWWNVTRGSSEFSYMNQGMERETSSPRNGMADQIVGDPTCPFVDFWQVAVKKDAPKDAVAIIEYDQYGYRFSISGLSVDLRFDMNCQLTYDSGPMAAPTAAPPEVIPEPTIALPATPNSP
jgi:hypothetical protein